VLPRAIVQPANAMDRDDTHDLLPPAQIRKQVPPLTRVRPDL